MYATRAPGYHTTPHAHEAEQINYVLEGEITMLLDDSEHEVTLRKGDMVQVLEEAIRRHRIAGALESLSPRSPPSRPHAGHAAALAAPTSR